MPTVTPTPTPKRAKPPKRSSRDDSIPFFDGSYYLLVTQLFDGVRKETGVGNKLKEATRGVGALGAHTKRRFSALSLLGKLATSLLLVALGAGIAAGGYVLLVRRDAAALRKEARAHLAKGELVEARRDVEALRLATGTLAPADRAALADPLRARLEAQSRKLRQEVESNARLGRHEKALAALDQFDALEIDMRWALFTRAEILRGAHRADAAAVYDRFATLYPDSDQADDAVYWQALLAKEGGRAGEARELCQKLLWKYPKSNFRTAADRMLAELAPPAPK